MKRLKIVFVALSSAKPAPAPKPRKWATTEPEKAGNVSPLQPGEVARLTR